jgi:hypothetical protein
MLGVYKMACIYCGMEITKWQIFWGWFWKLPLRISEFSQIWEECCSYKCYSLQLEKMLVFMQVESREVLDLSDFLLTSACKFITVEQVLEHIDKMKTTEWAEHIVAAGYRKVEPNSNPVDKVFKLRDK